MVDEVESEYDVDNRMLSMGEVEFEYDDSGNQLGVESTGGSVFLSTYVNGEKWNLRTTVNPDIEAGIPWASYSYSLDGRRVGKEIAWTVEPGDFQRVYYLYVDMDAEHPLEFRNEFRINGQNVVYEFGENHPTVRYTHPLVCDGGVCGPTAYMFVDAPISIVVDGVKYYYLYDGLGSVTELIDEDENMVNQYRYTPFGESIVKIEGVFNPYQYTGRRFDNETGQYYYRARMYSSTQGRFLSQDPLGMVDGPNMYVYARNNPILFRDPSGRWPPFWGNPMLINGGGGSIYDPWIYEGESVLEFDVDPSEQYDLKLYTVRVLFWDITYAARATLTREATRDFAFSAGWAAFLSSAIVGALIIAGILTGGVSLYVTGTMIAAAIAFAATCDYYNQRLALYWYIGGGVMPGMWCR